MTFPIRPLRASPFAAVLLALVLATAPAPAASPGTPPSLPGNPGAAAVVPSPVLAGNWLTDLWKPVESSLNTRAGLLRVGALGMVLALVIIMCGHKWSK